MSTTAVSAGRHRGPWRWLVALLATVLLVVSGSGLVVFAANGTGAGKGPAFVPATAAMYAVGRLDMPEGQGEALAEFLTPFPGFADSGSFQIKADEFIDGLVSEATGGALTFSGEMENFVTGEIGLAVSDLVESAMSGGDPEVLAGIAISDRAAATSFVDLLTANATDLAEEPYGNTAIVSDGDTAMAVHDEWILVGQTVEQVQAGIDTLEGRLPSLADDPQFAAAWARVPSAYLAAAYLNLSSFGSLMEMAGMAAGGQMGSPLPMEDLMAQLPLDMTAYLAAEGDRATLEAFITPSDQALPLSEGESDLAALFPADTQIYGEVRELGSTVGMALTQLMATLDEESASQIAPIESMLGTPPEEFLDFVSDAAVGGALNSDGIWVGMAAEVTDEATAAARFERLLSIVRLAGSQDTGISIDESEVDGATVTTITLPMDSESGGMPIPIGDTISVTVADGNLLLGTGDFVADALAQEPVDSLALSPGYTDALGEDTVNAGVLYANVSALLTAVEPLITMMAPDEAEAILPYATAIDRLIAVGSVDEVISSRISVIVDS